ncbi:MAG: hypothetical protein K2O89_05040 [Clostridia bacterium]|nr:hypothetical protein [Clostridia bacterium]
MKLYDFDGMFDEKLSEYIAKNSSKYKEEEWEDIIPELYRKFGDTPIKSLGKTPREYYGEMSGGELIKCLKLHLKNGVPVSEFLCSAIEEKKLTDELLPLLDGTADEVEYAMNLLGADPAVTDKYLKMLVESDDEDMKNRCVDFIKENADLVLDAVKENYKSGVEREYMLEIMSRITRKDDGVFDILVKEFRTDPDEVPMHASYLAAYGDERALKYLLDKIDEEGISFVEYQELKFAIEALGGEYTKERDFSSDPYYKLIKP